MATEDSVLMNIKGLFEMEADRRAEQAAAVERTKAEMAARVERERREREDALRVAREDERRRADAEAAARSREVEDRIGALRAELAEVRAAREQMRLEVAALAGHREPTRSRAHWIVGAMAAASLVAALAATYVSWPQPPAALTELGTVEVDEPAAAVEAPVEDVVVAAIDEAPAADPTPAAAPVERPSAPHSTRHAHADQRQDDLRHQLDFGDDDELIPEI